MIAKTILTALTFLIHVVVSAQVFNNPAVGLKSHPTMEIVKAEFGPDNTVITVSVENRRDGGTFCADRNIFLVYPDGTRILLEKASGIPVCPDAYKFRKTGEKLVFTLTFRSQGEVPGWADLIESCNDNCFSIYGILLNPELTSRIDKALSHVDKGEFDTAIALYKETINLTGRRDAGIAGSLYSDLVSLLVKKGYSAQASDWYVRLKNSNFPQKDMYISNLNSRGIQF